MVLDFFPGAEKVMGIFFLGGCIPADYNSREMRRGWGGDEKKVKTERGEI